MRTVRGIFIRAGSFGLGGSVRIMLRVAFRSVELSWLAVSLLSSALVKLQLRQQARGSFVSSWLSPKLSFRAGSFKGGASVRTRLWFIWQPVMSSRVVVEVRQSASSSRPLRQQARSPFIASRLSRSIVAALASLQVRCVIRSLTHNKSLQPTRLRRAAELHRWASVNTENKP